MSRVKMRFNKNNKVNWCISKLYMAAGLLLCLLPKFTTCSIFADAGYMPCWETAKILTIPGVIILLIGFASQFAKRSGWKITEHTGAAVTAWVSALIPAHFVCGCQSAEMMCHTVGFPMVYAIAAITGLAALVGICTSAVELIEKKAAMESL